MHQWGKFSHPWLKEEKLVSVVQAPSVGPSRGDREPVNRVGSPVAEAGRGAWFGVGQLFFVGTFTPCVSLPDATYTGRLEGKLLFLLL